MSNKADQDIVEYLHLCDELDPENLDLDVDRRLDELADILDARYGVPSDKESGYNYYEEILEKQERGNGN